MGCKNLPMRPIPGDERFPVPNYRGPVKLLRAQAHDGFE